MRIPFRAFLISLLIVSLIAVGNGNFGYVQAATTVSGIISTDTTWTLANSPYSLSGPVTIGNGVTLTIEAGVAVNLNGYKIQVNGIAYARGTINNNIVFASNPAGSEGITFTSSSTGWNEQTNAGSIIENSVLNSVSVSITSASPKLNNNTITASPNAVDKSAIFIDSGSPMISNNIIEGDIENLNSASPIITNNSIIGGIYGMGVLTSSSIITHNNVINGSWRGFGIRCDGINVYVADNTISNASVGINAYDGTSIIERNLVVDNEYGMVIGGMGTISPTIRNNTIVNNEVGIYVNAGPSGAGDIGSLTISYNNIQENSNNSIRLASSATRDIDAAYNWWGTTDTQTINQTIYDFKNNSNLGKANFVPFLAAPNPQAPSVEPMSPSPTPSPSPSPTPTPSPSPTPTPTPNPPAPTPNYSQISISVEPSSTTVGAAVDVNGRLLTSGGNPLQGKWIILSYAVAGSDSWFQIASDATDDVGEYSIQWVNTGSGTFTLKVEWNGDAENFGANASKTLSFLPYRNQNVFLVESNSTVTALAFSSTSSELSFGVSGPENTTGYVEASIAKSLVSNGAETKVYLDGNLLGYTLAETANAWVLTFSYHHSTHQVKIVVPIHVTTELALLGIAYWIWAAVAAIIITVAVACVAVWRIRKKQKTVDSA